MSTRQHRTILSLLIVAGALLVSLGLCSFKDLGTAHADTPAMLDAGPGAGSGSATAPTTATIKDPSVDPAGYISQLENAKKNGWGVVVLVVVFGLCEIAAAAGKNIAWLAWLGKGRLSIAIGGAAAISMTSINSLAAGGTWMSVGVAALGAVFLYLHPAAKDVAVAQAAKA